MGFLLPLATLVVILALNWRRLSELGTAGVLRLSLIWGVIILALMLLVQLMGWRL